jgi:cysteine-rich repeat protein
LAITVLVTATTAGAVSNPTVTGPITAACSPLCPSPPGPANGIHIPDPLNGNSNLAEFTDAGYVEEEYFFEGTATAYQRDASAPAWDATGFWTAIPSTTIAPAAYKSRMLVRRPADPADFNGIVIMEWLNVTAGGDLAPDYGYFRTEVLRSGYIWVGVTAQSVGVNGGIPAGFGLKSYDPVRYGTLVHPGDNYCYDIFSQAAQAVLHPSGVNPLGSPDYVITGFLGDGESQSAGRMTTYVNAIHPVANLFDGYLIHSRSANAAALFSGGGGAVPTAAKIRTDIVPVMVFETETDTVGHFSARQADGPNYRLWEPAGTAHADFYDFSYFALNQATQTPFYPATSCTFTPNLANQKYVMNAALDALAKWIHGGTPPPNAPSPITVVSSAIQRSSLGIALGGIRLPEIDVPSEVHQGTGNNGTAFCTLFGRTIPLPVAISTLYDSHSDYVAAYTTATNALQTAGFILPVDAAEAIANAQASTVGIRCGNGETESGETCDDGNTAADDGCSATCAIETGWTCAGDPSTCAPICGDTLILGTEQCDDGNAASDDGCSAVCTVEPGYSCMGNPSACVEVCGDALVVGDEGCDDGNTASGDGCAAACTVESGWTCAGEPSLCAPICGDGVILGTETCDEGASNGAPTSCCSTTCQPEPGGAACDDGNACTTSDACNGANVCVGGAPPSCNDGNACTADSCVAPTGCVHDAAARDGYACDDGVVCSTGDVCAAGVCAGTTGADTDADGYCDAEETARGCDPNDGGEIPPQSATFAGVPLNGQGSFLATYLVPTTHKVAKATDPSCAVTGVCGANGFCTAGKVADPCLTASDCDQPANSCRVVINYALVPDLAARKAFVINKTAVPAFEPIAPGCSRKVDVTLDPARKSNVLKVNVQGTVSGRVRRDADTFKYR